VKERLGVEGIFKVFGMQTGHIEPLGDNLTISSIPHPFPNSTDWR